MLMIHERANKTHSGTSKPRPHDHQTKRDLSICSPAPTDRRFAHKNRDFCWRSVSKKTFPPNLKVYILAIVFGYSHAPRAR